MNASVSRQSFLGRKTDEVLRTSKIAIIGLCGGGSHIAQQLAHIGFEKFIICDHDHVEDSNLTRMVGATPKDAEIAQRKTTIIERLIRSINPAAHVIPINIPWQQRQISLRDCIAIIGCVDSYLARDELEQFCRRFLIPYIDIGMDIHQGVNGYHIAGQIVISLPGSPCMRCLGLINDTLLAEEAQKYGAAGGRPQVIWPNGVLASLAVGQLMALLLPWDRAIRPSIMMEYDGNRQIVFPSPKLPLLESRACPHFSGTDTLGDPFFSL